MKVNFHIRRRSETAPATGLLLLSFSSEDLARLLGSLGCDPLPPVYEVADGFLLKLSEPLPKTVGGVLRLRSLADNVYLPVDAELVPALLTEESVDFGRLRGIVFLPHGRTLEFDPARPVPLSAVVTAGQLRRDAWQPLPQPEPLADELSEITLEQPEITLDDLLAAGGKDIGTEALPTDDDSMPSKALGKTAFGAGKTLAWLGKMLGMKGLAKTGMKWMEAGLGMAPSLAESVLGRQEASLRALLRAFREGKIEQALRRAVPLDNNTRGSAPSSGTSLPFHDLIYSLQNILGGSGGGAGTWPTDYELFQELTREYRRQAELATQRGDFRRAAFIYAKLLGDYRTAAAVLARGGLHRDAAIIYLKRLDDALAAAREYEAAGESDRALALYRKRQEHLLAGDLLRRMGEEENAQAEYRLAADHLVENGRGYYEAGELLRTRAHLETLAVKYYQSGWEQRPAGSPVPCALRLAQSMARAEASAELLALASEADEYLDTPGNDLQAAEFYNELAQLAGKFPQATVQDDLRDLALMGIAGKMRQRGAAGSPTTTMFSAAQVWPPAVVSDAQFALKRLNKRPIGKSIPSGDCTGIQIPARLQVVTAVCQAAHSGDVFVGFESGEVMCYRPSSGEVVAVTDTGTRICSLAASNDGNTTLILTLTPFYRKMTLRSVTRNLALDSTQSMTYLREEGDGQFCLGVLGNDKRFIFGVNTGTAIEFFEGDTLVPVGHWKLPGKSGEPCPTTVLLLRSLPSGALALLGLYPFKFVYWDYPLCEASSVASGDGWQPDVPKGCGLQSAVLSRFDKSPQGMELAGVGSEGHLYHSDLQLGDGKFTHSCTKALSAPFPFLAAAVIRPGLVAGVTRSGARWLRPTTAGLVVIGQTDVSLPSAIACFPHHRGKELIVVCADGTVVRVPSACF